MKTKVVPFALGIIVTVGVCFLCVQTALAQNARVRIMAANISSGTQQSYEAPGIRIFQGLQPDIVAIQEFQVSGNSDSNTLRTLVDSAFGPSFNFYCETNNGIPNGVVSRHPILNAGFWTDVQVPDRGFVWAQIDLPGTNDVYVVSVHLHGNGGPSSRAIEATNLKDFIQTSFPSNAWIIVGGDFNTTSRTEACMNTFATFLSDNPVPTDLVSGGNSDTSEPRSNPYDYLLPSFSMTNRLTPLIVGPQTFAKGLVFDSTIYANTYTLASVAPVQSGDSHVTGMQHMAVLKDFLIPTNSAPVNDPPAITAQPQSQTNSIGANVSFSVSASGTAPLAYQWRFYGTNLSGATTNPFSMSNIQPTNAGNYTVVITNAFGSITSSVATLTVTTSPTISTNPQSQTVTVGGNATFSVVASGSVPLSYQWRFAGTNIGGATLDSYTRSNAQLVDAGNYTVVVTNSFGSVTSAVAVLTVNTVSTGTNLVISQIYGGGGNASASYRNDFVEIFNSSPSAINVSTWSVQYASSSGTSWQVVNLTGTIQPYRYYLVQLASGGAVGILLPTADATGGVNISASQGKIALASSQTALSGSNPIGGATVVDFVGFGSANAFEGSAAAGGAPSGNNTTSVLRKNGGFTDSNNNTNDFTTVSPPTPRNSASPANPPSTPAITPTITNAALVGTQFQFQLTGTTGSNYIVEATANLSPATWISLRTNAAPFTFVESNVFALPQRFYRGMIAP